MNVDYYCCVCDRRVLYTCARVLREHLSSGGGCLIVAYVLQDADYRLCVFARIETGGCISGKKLFENGKTLSSGQNTPEINF